MYKISTRSKISETYDYTYTMILYACKFPEAECTRNWNQLCGNICINIFFKLHVTEILLTHAICFEDLLTINPYGLFNILEYHNQSHDIFKQPYLDMNNVRQKNIALFLNHLKIVKLGPQ